MFSGIVETTCIITQLNFANECLLVSIKPQKYFDDLNIGDSVAINGVCLTVTELQEDSFNATIVPETLRLTNLKNLTLHARVNLERSLKASSRIGGHYVQGHVDAAAEILELRGDGKDALIAKISLPRALAKYVVRKGYIGIDGMSITVIEAASDYFTVTFIPHTQEVSITHQYRQGSLVNLEVDILGKYVEKLLGAYAACNLTSKE
jgi:riboflavin synthase